jgi:hypothetical protein
MMNGEQDVVRGTGLPFRIPYFAFRIHRSPSFLNISLIPLTAWRVRASFSIKAKRT